MGKYLSPESVEKAKNLIKCKLLLLINAYMPSAAASLSLESVDKEIMAWQVVFNSM